MDWNLASEEIVIQKISVFNTVSLSIAFPLRAQGKEPLGKCLMVIDGSSHSTTYAMLRDIVVVHPVCEGAQISCPCYHK